MSWDSNDFKLNRESNNNSGDAQVVLLRKITGSQEPDTPLYVKYASATGESQNVYSSVAGELLTSQRTVLFDIKPIYGLSEIRDVTSSVSGATITHNPSTLEFEITTANSASSVGIIESAEIGRYISNYELISTIAIRSPQNPVGDQVFKWGYFNEHNGFYFGKDITGSFIAVKNSGSIRKQVYQTDWNLDKLDGSGSSLYDISQFPDSGHIYTIKFLWHGYGFIEWVVSVFDSKNKQLDVSIHRERITGSPSIANPHLPVRLEVNNGATAQSASVFMTCRSISINGNYSPKFRITSERVLSQSVTTTFRPFISFKKRPGIKTNVGIHLIHLLTDTNILLEIRSNATLTGSSFSTPSTTQTLETSVLSDISATGSSGGIFIIDGLLEGAGGNKSTTISEGLPKQDFVDERPMTLSIRTIGGAGSVTAIFQVNEEW